MLLKEALKHRPWAASHALTSCTADGKFCRRRFNTLLEVFRRDELESLRASGSAEDYEEREQLMIDFMTLHAQAKAGKTEKEKREAEHRSSESELSTPQPSKKKKKSSTEALVEFLDSKADRSTDLSREAKRATA
ncbi:hypothetical protein GN244_ATG08890 [Phytophthora infestans]|uniref:Uncharacterized protein n=1 Tax=Phytophthora infestans TaxID=4787 RepID=A0A833SUN8_PHYIN|nr:hypothetical protein GN244_ATG08890 [Phytophthora infestans]